MSRLSASQDHLAHILILAGFLIALLVSNAQSLVDRPLLVASMALLYVVVNSAVDSKAGMLRIDTFLQYATIALFAFFVIISF